MYQLATATIMFLSTEISMAFNDKHLFLAHASKWQLGFTDIGWVQL